MTETAAPPETGSSSRDDARFAGWHCKQKGTFVELEPKGRRPKFSWLRPSVLWAARNDPLVRWFGDPTDDQRRRWIASQRARGVEGDFTIDRSDLGDGYSMLVAGDTGEGDHSQYAVVPGLLKAGDGTSFLVVLSDVIYPIGSVNDYIDKFFRPYSEYPAAIYAIPGNHDWYDGLGGFMRHFCGAEPLPDQRLPGSGVKAWLRDKLWRGPSVLGDETLQECRDFRPHPRQKLGLPGPYWTIDTGPVRFVGIDTGIIGNIDGEQADWLKRVSAGPKPKILLTGKPIYVDNECHPGTIAGRDFTIDDVVRDPANNYVAAIGGDIHNYQRYPVPVDGRTIQYIVSGGGGAFMHATHTIPKVNVNGASEDEFRCYPLRGDSLAFYSRLYSRKLTRSGLLQIHPEQASALIASRCETTTTRPGAQQPTRATRIKGAIVGLLPSGKTFHKYLSEFADWDDPPLFKSFLRLDVSADAVRVRCFAATGCRAQEIDPPVEDDFLIPLH
jgi:Calcineurin-like phosphoesterase